MSLAPYVKAVAAFVSTASAGLLAALLLGSPGDATVTTAEWIGIASTTIVATAGVFFAPANRPADPAA
jgi:hypothetical protein